MPVVTKAEIIRQVLATAKEPYNYDVLLLACRSKIEQLPVEQRKGLVVGRHNLHRAISNLRIKRGTPPTAANGHTPKPPTAPPPPESFTVNEMIAAGKLLEVCGGSVYRSNLLIKTISELTGKRED